MKNLLLKNIPKIDLGKKINILFLLAIIIITFQAIIFFIADGRSFFLINDSYGYYFTEAKNIYRQGSLHDISKLILDLYFDQIREANYDFAQIKPYHFPVYSSYLSIFFHFSENEFFIVALSEFFPCLIMLYFSYLILINYFSSKKSFTIIVLAFLCSPIVIFTCDSNAEIFAGSLIILSFYLGLFAKKREGFLYYFCYFLVNSILFLRIKFLVGISILCLIYRILPIKYTEENKKIEKKNIIFLLIFAIFLPSAISYYAYENLNLHLHDDHDFKHLFSFEKIYDLFDRLVVNLFQILVTNLWYGAVFLTFVIGLFFYWHEIYKIFLLRKISKILVIYSFGFLFFISILVFYGTDGYRMLISFYPFVFIVIYENRNILKKIKFCNRNLFALRTLLVFTMITFFYNNYSTIKNFPDHQEKMMIKTKILEKIMDQYEAKNVVINLGFFDQLFRLPFMHLLSQDKYIFMIWNVDKTCEIINGYAQDNFEFKFLILPKNLKSECDFIAKNYKTEINSYKELNEDLLIYIKK
jgi:hypothetical protein